MWKRLTEIVTSRAALLAVAGVGLLLFVIDLFK